MKLKRKIHLIFLLLLFSCLAKIKGQGIALSDSIEFHIEPKNLNEVFHLLAEKTGITFAYRNKLLEGKIQQAINHTGTIEEIIQKILIPYQLCFTEQNGQIIIHTACSPKHYTASGYIVQQEGQNPIPYVSVALINGKKGVIADHNGYFEINLDYSTIGDTLILSCMGYQRDTIVVKPVNQETLLIILDERVYDLPPTIIRPNQYSYKKLGNSKDKPSGSLYLDTHGQQTALYLENQDKITGKIETVEFYLSKKGNTDAPFRVRIYSVDSAGLPGYDLVKDAIVVKPKVAKGWYRIDISKENIEFPVDGAFFAIEGVFPDDFDFYYGSAGFIDLKDKKKSKNTENPLTYGQRLGYNRKCRKNTWHYSMSKIWFQLEKQSFGIMISATIKYEKKTGNNDQENE